MSIRTTQEKLPQNSPAAVDLETVLNTGSTLSSPHMIDSGGNTLDIASASSGIRIDPTTNTTTIGDSQSVGSNTVISITDGTNINIDSKAVYTVIGDVGFVSNGTTLKVDDSNRDITLTTRYIKFNEDSLPTANLGDVWTLTDRSTGAGAWTPVPTWEPVISAGTTAQYWRGDKTWQTLNQAAVSGLTTASSPTFAGLTLSGLTSGSVPFAGTSGVISQDNATLFWNNTSKRLGVGTNSPSGKLHIVGSADVPQLIVKANSTQSTNLVEAQNSSGSAVMAVTNTGTATFRRQVAGNNGYIQLATGANPGITIYGESGVGYYPSVTFYSAGTNVGSIQGYNGLLFAPAAGYSAGVWSYYQATTAWYYKTGYAGTHTVPLGKVQTYQGANSQEHWQDGSTNRYGAAASVYKPIKKRSGLTATPSATAGTLAAGTYYYKVTACNFMNETIGSSEANATITAGQSVALSWTYADSDGVDHYHVYRSTVSGSYGASSRIDSTSYPTTGIPYYTTTFTDTGFTATTGTPPTSKTHDTMTYRRWDGQTGALMDFEDETGATLCQVKFDGSIQPASIADASASNNSLYYSTTQNKLVYKDSGGVVNNLY